MAELSLRFMGIGTDRLRHTLERSRGLNPATKKKRENASVVPPLNFPQRKWKAGKTPRVSKNKVKYLHRVAVAEVCFTDTFETADNTYKPTTTVKQQWITEADSAMFFSYLITQESGLGHWGVLLQAFHTFDPYSGQHCRECRGRSDGHLSPKGNQKCSVHSAAQPYTP